MKYNIDGTHNQLQLEICNLQQNVATIRDCNIELQKIHKDDAVDGFSIALMVIAIWSIGYVTGKMSR